MHFNAIKSNVLQQYDFPTEAGEKLRTIFEQEFCFEFETNQN